MKIICELIIYKPLITITKVKEIKRQYKLVEDWDYLLK